MKIKWGTPRYRRQYYLRNLIKIKKQQAAYYQKVSKKRNGHIDREVYLKQVVKSYKNWVCNISTDPKIRARLLIHRAVYRGRLKKSDKCEGCGKVLNPKYLHGHHKNYQKWWDVKWLCHQCHVDRHPEWGSVRTQTKIKNGTLGRNKYSKKA